MANNEQLPWATIGTGVLAAVATLISGYLLFSQNEEVKDGNLNTRIGRLEGTIKTLDIAAIKRELESLKRDQALLVSKNASQKQILNIEEKIQSIDRQLVAVGSSSPNIDINRLAKTIVDQYAEKIRGPKGVSGVKGATGETGDIGLTGPKGSTGSQGIAGIRGKIGKSGSTAAGNSVSADEIDRYIKEAVARAVSALPVVERKNTSISTIPEGKIFTSGDCVELNPLKKSISANLAFGGSICLDGIPYATISHTNGCSYFSMSTDKRPGGASISIGKRLTIAVGKRKITIQPGCKIKDKNFYYPTRIFWSSK